MRKILFALVFIQSLFSFSQENKNNKIIEVHGHRGFRGKFPENTLTTFKEAAKLGVDFIEFDVVISKDSQVVISHEPWFNYNQMESL
jgi:glycerophosphoryl diester phosphodiesterase